MKKTYAPTSNPNFNIPMTEEQWAIINFLAFESEHAKYYAYGKQFNELNMDDINKIIKVLIQNAVNEEVMFNTCIEVLGTNEIDYDD
jgi:hypothetical protein